MIISLYLHLTPLQHPSSPQLPPSVSHFFTLIHCGLPRQARLERMADFQQRGDELENNFAECKRLLEEAQGRLKELEKGRNEGEEDEEREAELRKVQAEVRKLKKDEKLFEKKMEEQRREEKKLPWNVDTLSKEGFSKVRDQGRKPCKS